MRTMKKNANLLVASRRSLTAVTVAGAAVLLLGGGGQALASTPAAATITACYKTSQSPSVLSHLGSGNCPAGDTKLSWSKQGPAGPQGPAGQAGVAVGLTANSVQQVAMTGGWETVLRSPATSTSGEYYVTASVVAFIDTGDSIACRVEGSAAPHTWDGGASPVTVPVIGAVSAPTGRRIVVQCEDTAGDAASGVFSGTIQAILVGNSVG